MSTGERQILYVAKNEQQQQNKRTNQMNKNKHADTENKPVATKGEEEGRNGQRSSAWRRDQLHGDGRM